MNIARTCDEAFRVSDSWDLVITTVGYNLSYENCKTNLISNVKSFHFKFHLSI